MLHGGRKHVQASLTTCVRCSVDRQNLKAEEQADGDKEEEDTSLPEHLQRQIDEATPSCIKFYLLHKHEAFCAILKASDVAKRLENGAHRIDWVRLQCGQMCSVRIRDNNVTVHGRRAQILQAPLPPDEHVLGGGRRALQPLSYAQILSCATQFRRLQAAQRSS
jgi:hypothetical protein